MQTLNRYSRIITQDVSQGASQAMLYATLPHKSCSDTIRKPHIGICSTWLSGNPCNMHLLKYSHQVAESVRQFGMLDREFATTGVSDGISMGTDGMRYSLPSRELICDSIESTMRAMHYDGFIGIPGCDKNIPAMIMALLRLNRPGFLIYGGSTLPGSYKKKERVESIDVVSAFQSYGEMICGKITSDERETILRNACPGAGACGGMYTANTMAIVAEVLGLSLPNSSSNMAESDQKQWEISQSGILMGQLLDQDLKPRDIVTMDSIRNALIVATALGGSTNMILHILAIAYEAKVPLTLKKVRDIIDDVPLIGDFKPSGKHVMQDLNSLGGTKMVTKYLLDQGLLNGSVFTIYGQTLEQSLNNVPKLCWNQAVIRSLESPIKSDGHLKILHGNLAPYGCVAKITGKEGDSFQGPAVTFDTEEDMITAAENGKILPGMVIVIRYQGPRVGMPEMLKPTSILAGLGLLDKVALITDGRFSGGSHGFIIGHICPEAYNGGPISQVSDGDIISIDIIRKRIHVALSKSNDSSSFQPKLTGYLQKFSRLVKNASEGCRTVL